MTPLFAPEAVRAMDERAFGRGVPSLALMEKAAGHLARAITGLAGRGYGLRVALLCGKGNNGGDGLAAARRLVAAGAQPVVHLVAGADALGGDAEVQLGRWQAMGGRLADSADDALAGADVAVDCLLGTGASGAPRGPYLPAVQALGAFAGPVVACDLPSGVDAATGQVPGEAVSADLTLTLGAHKVGLWLSPARTRCGRIVLGELGIREPDDQSVAHLLDHAGAAAALPTPSSDAHKYSRGTVLVVAGSPDMSGAATMVARGAMAAGAGLITVATSERARALVAASVPEALTLALPDGDPDAAFAALEERLDKADAVIVGPGLGTGEATVALVRRLVAEVRAPLVLDADGINAFRHDGDALADHASGMLVLTPHEREFGRTATADPGERERIWAERVSTVPTRAASWDAVIVAKGPGTLIAAPDGRLWVNPTGNAALATGGTGDVLAGLIAGALAQRAEPEVVAAAVYLHGLAGQAAAARSHVRSVTALDVAAAVPDAFCSLDEVRDAASAVGSPT